MCVGGGVSRASAITSRCIKAKDLCRSLSQLAAGKARRFHLDLPERGPRVAGRRRRS